MNKNNEKIEKKTWSKPVLEELDIYGTKSGTPAGYNEDIFGFIEWASTQSINMEDETEMQEWYNAFISQVSKS